MTTAAGLLTAEDFAALPRDSIRLELVRGEILARPPGYSDRGIIVMAISVPITQYILMTKLGVVYAAGTGFLLSRNPDAVRAPDCAFIQASRVTPTAVATFWNPVIPDLVVEVVSSGDRPKAIAEKVSMWLDVIPGFTLPIADIFD